MWSTLISLLVQDLWQREWSYPQRVWEKAMSAASVWGNSMKEGMQRVPTEDHFEENWFGKNGTLLHWRIGPRTAFDVLSRESES